MKIGFFAEGSYPYVVGGVSSWSHMLLTHFQEHAYYLHTVTATEAEIGHFRYDVPGNVRGIVETALQGDDVVSGPHRMRYTAAQKEALRGLVLGEDTDWATLFRLFDDPKTSIDAVLMGPEFLEIVTELYERHYSRTIYTDFLWSIRSMHLPLFRILKGYVEPCDLYQTVSTGYAGILGVKGSMLHGKPLLLTEHGIYTREREEELIKADWTHGVYKDLWISFFYNLSACCYQQAGRVVSLFESARTLQIEIGCPAEKTQVIPNGVSYQRYQDLEQKSADDPFINVGSVLRVTPIKDVKTMINAFAIAKAQVPQLKLWIMGPTEEDEAYYASCLELVRSLGVQDIVFTGRIDVRAYLGKMDIMLLTSISEGQPLSLLEAMAAEKPCIATRVGNCEGLLLGEADDLGPCGIVAPVMNATAIGQAIVRLAKSPDLRAQMGSVGRQRVYDRYTDQAFLAQYAALYQALTKGT